METLEVFDQFSYTLLLLCVVVDVVVDADVMFCQHSSPGFAPKGVDGVVEGSLLPLSLRERFKI